MKKLTTLFLLLAFNLSAQISVNLVRQSDGVIIGTALLDEQFCGQADTIPVDTSGGVKLYFDGLASEYISCDYNLTGEFDLITNTQSVSDVGGWIGLYGSNSANRLLLSNSNQRFWANLNSGSLSKRNNLVYDSGLILKTRIYRDAANDIYIQFNNETPFYCFSSSNTIAINQICKAHDKYFKGYLLSYEINGETWSLSEGSGTILTGSNGTIHTLEGGSWMQTPSQISSVQVYNEGVGGNSVNDLLNRTADVSQHAPDLIFLWGGTNNVLNALGSKITSVSEYQDSLQALVQKLKTENDSTEIVLINIIPCIDSILKTTHDYSSYYGADSTFNLNEKIDTFNLAINTVASLEGLTVLDANSLVDSNISWITDGTHISATGYGGIAQLCITTASGKLIIVCFGDSLTAGQNVSGGFDYPTQLEQLLNE